MADIAEASVASVPSNVTHDVNSGSDNCGASRSSLSAGTDSAELTQPRSQACCLATETRKSTADR